MSHVDLRGVNEKDEFVRRVKEAVKSKYHALLTLCYIFIRKYKNTGSVGSFHFIFLTKSLHKL